MAAPEYWTGQQVRVGLDFRSGTEGGLVAELEEVNDEGIVLRYNVAEGERPIFYPWALVMWIYPVEEPAGEEQSEHRRMQPRAQPAEIPEDPAP